MECMGGAMRPARPTRRRLLRGALTLGAAAPLAGLLAACGGGSAKPAGSQQPVTLLMVNSGAIPQGWNDLGQAFTREYPPITVTFSGTESLPWGQYFEKVAVMAAGGSP